MKSKLKFYRVIITNCEKKNRNYLRLYKIFYETVSPGISFSAFHKYYFSGQLEYIDVTFCYFNRQLIGFCSAAFYAMDVHGKKMILGRAATGIHEQHRGKALPKLQLFSKYASYKINNPLLPLLVSIFVINPLIYAMLCKYTAIIWPGVKRNAPQRITQFKDALISTSDIVLEEESPFVVKVNFTVAISKKLAAAVMSSSNRHIKNFMQMVRELRGSSAVVTIIPFTWTNIFFSLALLGYYFIIEKFYTLAKNASHKFRDIFTFIRIIMLKLKRGT